MFLANRVQVTQADFDMPRDAADAAAKDPDKVAVDLWGSAPWQHHLRQQKAKRWS
jgi:hypothetical protein